MRIIERRRAIAASAALLAALAPAAPAHACVPEGAAVALLLGAVVVPSEVGFTVPTAAYALYGMRHLAAPSPPVEARLTIQFRRAPWPLSAPRSSAAARPSPP